MTLVVELNPDEEAWLASQAVQEGLEPSNIVRRLIGSQLSNRISHKETERAASPIDAKNAAAIAYLDARIREDGTDDPEEIRKAEEEIEELKRNLNANRAATGERLVCRRPLGAIPARGPADRRSKEARHRRDPRRPGAHAFRPRRGHHRSNFHRGASLPFCRSRYVGQHSAVSAACVVRGHCGGSLGDDHENYRRLLSILTGPARRFVHPGCLCLAIGPRARS